jgi:hypothetical protein
MEKINMDSLVTVLTEVEKMGFTTQFEVTEKGLVSLKTGDIFLPGQVSISHFYRFEGDSNPDDSSILYAIETDTCERGTLVDGYGVSAESTTSSFFRKVKQIQK